MIDLLTQNARERGAMVLVVTHDPRLVPFADRVFELADGQMQNAASSSPLHLRDDSPDDQPDPPDETSAPLPFRKQSPRLQLYVPQPAAMA